MLIGNEWVSIMSSDSNIISEINEYSSPSFPQKLLDNPVTDILIGALGLIPTTGPIIQVGLSSVVALLRDRINSRQQKKLENILSDIADAAEAKEITEDDVAVEDAIFEFAQLWESCKAEISEKKIEYLTRLYIGSLKEAKPEVFEEQLNKLSSLSISEINFLIEFYRIQSGNSIPMDNGRLGFNYIETWGMVLEHFKAAPYNMNETDCIAMASGIQRTGFCICEWTGALDGGKVFAYVTPGFESVMNKLSKQ